MSAFGEYIAVQIAALATALEISPDALCAPIECEAPAEPLLFVVWLDLSFGGEFGPAEWVENSEPQPLADALAEAHEAREEWRRGGSPWVCAVVLEGCRP